MSFDEQLQRIEPLTHVIANHFYCLEFNNALQLLPQLMEESQQIILEYQKTNTKSDASESILSFMEIVYTSLDKKDYILLADLLKYEWMKYLGMLRANLSYGESV